MKRAILMLSIGDRPWARCAFETFERYAEKIGADAHLVTEDPPATEFDLGVFRATTSRPNKRAYALKSYIPWKFMSKGYDQVVMVDDSCSVHPYATSIFDEVPRGFIGYTRTSATHAELSFQVIRDFQQETGERPIEFNPKHYANSGVVVYDRLFMDAFDPQKILEAKLLLYAKYPHQTLLYYLVKNSEIPVRMMPKKFNGMPGMRLGKDQRRQLSSIEGIVDLEAVYITHYSGAYRNRRDLITQTSRWFLQLWDQCEAK